MLQELKQIYVVDRKDEAHLAAGSPGMGRWAALILWISLNG